MNRLAGMARTVDTTHRDELLDAVARDLLRGGLVGASLERLAAAAGTSARMLVHHFGAKQALLDAALRRCREWELDRARAELPAGPDFPRVLARAWTWFGSDEAGQYFRLFGQLAASSRLGTDHAGVSRVQLSTEWLTVVGDGFLACGCRPPIARRLATVVVAQIRGLLLDLDATGDSERVQDAYEAFMELLVADLATGNHKPGKIAR
jgi:AcrR family transcriptional regulator